MAVDWAQGRDDTFISMTPDHEMGGPTVIQKNGQGVTPTVSRSTTEHTSQQVPVYALGANAFSIVDVMDNTDVFAAMIKTIQ